MLTIIVAVLSAIGLYSVAHGLVSGIHVFRLLPVLAISLFGGVIVLRYRKSSSVPKWMFYAWSIPQALMLDVARHVDGVILHLVPPASIFPQLTVGLSFRASERIEVGVGAFVLSALVLVVFLVFLEEWDDEQKKAAEPGATDNPDGAQ